MSDTEKTIFTQMLATSRSVLTPIHPAGWPFVAAFALCSALLMYLWVPLGWAGLLLTAWCVYFFRDPDRVTPQGDLVVAPGDGRFLPIAHDVAAPPELGLEGSFTRVSIFLNVFDVHVNRVPCTGTIDKVIYHAGKFLSADLDKASLDNERSAAAITTPGGQRLAFVQIAGLVARRIICNLKDGQQVIGGERYGLIRFGSRCDIYLPPGVAPEVLQGQRAVGGETIIARLGAARAAAPKPAAKRAAPAKRKAAGRKPKAAT